MCSIKLHTYIVPLYVPPWWRQTYVRRTSNIQWWWRGHSCKGYIKVEVWGLIWNICRKQMFDCLSLLVLGEKTCNPCETCKCQEWSLYSIMCDFKFPFKIHTHSTWNHTRPAQHRLFQNQSHTCQLFADLSKMAVINKTSSYCTVTFHQHQNDDYLFMLTLNIVPPCTLLNNILTFGHIKCT